MSSAKCACCGVLAKDDKGIINGAKVEHLPLDEYVKIDGTYVEQFDMYICNDCYVKAGCPSMKVFGLSSEEEVIKAKIQLINRVRKILE